MRTTQLYIKINGQWRELDLYDNVSIPLTYKVTDIRQFGSKTTGFSLDFDLPHTNNNAQIFGLNSEINAYNSTFEVGRDYPANLTNNGLTTFSGQFRLKKVFKQHGGKNIYYVGYLYGGVKSFVDELGNQTLIGNDNPDDDLSFSEYAITAGEFTIQEVRNRLTQFDTGGADWGLTFIDKTNKNSVPFGVDGVQYWETNELTPYLPVMGILNKIFAGTSWNYVSEFLQGAGSQYMNNSRWVDTIGQFDIYNMVYPYPNHNSQLGTQGAPVELYITQAVNDKGRFFGYDIFPTNAEIQPFLEFEGLTTNPLNLNYSIPQNTQYEILNWQPSRDGKYKIKISLPFKLGLMFGYYYFDGGVWNQVKFNQVNATEHAFTYPLEVVFNLCTMRNNQEIILYEQNFTWQNTEGATLTQYTTEIWDNASVKVFSRPELTDTFIIDNVEMLLRRTDVLYFKIRSYVPFTDNGTPAFYANTPELGNNTRLSGAPRVYNLGQPVGTEIMSFLQVVEFAEGQDFDPTIILNSKTKKMDFFNNLVKMFNLYVEDVSNKPNYATGGIYPDNTLRIEPFEMFYSPIIGNGQTNIKDWTEKINWETVEYRRIDDYLYNTLNFKYQHDNDFFTKQYNDTYKLAYGDQSITGVYCRNDDQQEINVSFGSYTCGLINDTTETAQTPKMFSLTNKNEIDTKKEYSGGIYFLWDNDIDSQAGLNASYLIVRSSVTPNNNIIITKYFCADNLNNGYGTATADLNFSLANENLQQLRNNAPTNNNLFNAFYSKQYYDYTAPDARILRATAYLTPFDIATVQMSDLIVINGDSYHIGEINQWKDEKTPCEIELIKCIPTPPPTN